MRPIDADELLNKTANLEAVALEQVAKCNPSEDPEGWHRWSAIHTERTAFKYDLMDAPTVDAVEVVRCKDCRYYDDENHFCAYIIWAKPDGYCSGGERREDDCSNCGAKMDANAEKCWQSVGALEATDETD